MPRLLSTRYVSLERDAPFSSCVVDGNNSRRRPLSVDLSVTKKRAALSRHSPHLLKSGAGQAQKQCTQNRARAVHYFLSCPDLCSESFPMFCSEFVGGPINGGGGRDMPLLKRVKRCGTTAVGPARRSSQIKTRIPRDPRLHDIFAADDRCCTLFMGS